MKPEKLIECVVLDFYKKATSDVLIGYHFRKIIPQDQINPLAPPIERFKDHLPRIENFWKQQLLSLKSKDRFDLITVHRQLNIRKGELARWIMLFKESLNHYRHIDEEFISRWETKVDQFEKSFIRAKVFDNPLSS